MISDSEESDSSSGEEQIAARPKRGMAARKEAIKKLPAMIAKKAAPARKVAAPKK
jgi:hypothetical protein